MAQVIHVKVEDEWYKGLNTLAKQSEGTIHQQTRLAIRERLEREGMIEETTSTTTDKKEQNHE